MGSVAYYVYLVSGTQTSFFFFVGAGKNEGLGHRLGCTKLVHAVRQHSGRIVLGDHKNASRQDDS